jgi:hypothetical protein
MLKTVVLSAGGELFSVCTSNPEAVAAISICSYASARAASGPGVDIKMSSTYTVNSNDLANRFSAAPSFEFARHNVAMSGDCTKPNGRM